AIKSSAGNLGLERLRLIVQEIEARAELGDETWSELRMYVAGEIDDARPALEVHLERSDRKRSQSSRTIRTTARSCARSSRSAPGSLSTAVPRTRCTAIST